MPAASISAATRIHTHTFDPPRLGAGKPDREGVSFGVAGEGSVETPGPSGAG